MWCFCRKRSSTLEDEHTEDFIRIVCNNSAGNVIADNHKADSTSSEEKRKVEFYAKQSDCSEISGRNKEYENSEIYSKFIDTATESTSDKLPANLPSSDSSLIAEVGMRLHKVEVHNNFGNQVGCSSRTQLNTECIDASKVQDASGSLETSFSSHCTQTENGILPAPLMKRRGKTKSSELTESQIAPRNSNTPLDLSHKSVSNNKDVECVASISPKYKNQENLPIRLCYENLPTSPEAIIGNQKDLLVPLDLSIGSSGQKKDEGHGESNLLSLHLELYPLNLSKKNYVPIETASPSSFGRSYNGELSPVSMETNNTQCFSTASSRPDLLSNVDNDDYGFNDHPKVGFFNGTYDKTSLNRVTPQSVHKVAGYSPDIGRAKVFLPPFFSNVFHCGSESMEASRPLIAHGNSFNHSNISSNQGQPGALLSTNPSNVPSQQYSGSNICLSRASPLQNAFPRPKQAHCHSNRDMSNSSSLHSLSNHSTNNSYYNPSYQNHTLEEASYAVLDEIHKKPLYDNLKPAGDSVYEIYDDQSKICSMSKGPVYANVLPEAENIYFAYDNNTYIPPQRLKKKESAYENDISNSQADHTYSTIGSPNDATTSSTKDVPAELADTCSETKLPSDQSCSKSQLTCSDSVPIALNLVKVPEIPLPVKVKSSSNGRNFMKINKNANGNGSKSSKLSSSGNKSSKFGNKFKGKIKEITLVESSGSILDELLSPSTPKQTSRMLLKNKKPSLTSLASHHQKTPEKIGPSLEACGKKFSSLSDMKKNSASPSSILSTPKSKNSKSGRSLLSSFSFRGDKKQPVPKKSESSRLLSGKNKWSNSSAASLGSIASLASSSSSLSNYVHPPSIASEGGLLSNYTDEFDWGILIPSHQSVPPCMVANANDSTLMDNFKLLRECPWYWGALDVKGAEEMLSGKQDGVFLVRDSSDEGCIISLTFRSLQMTHHTRIEYKNGILSFHIPVPRSPQISSSSSPPPTPSINSNIVEFMIRAMEDSIQNCNNLSTNTNACWLYLERSGPSGTSRVPVKLFSPVSKRLFKERIPSLKSLARKLIVKIVKKGSISLLPLSHWLKAYLLIEFI